MNRDRLTDFNALADSLYKFSKQRQGFTQDVEGVNYIGEPDNSNGILGKTAYYNPADKTIAVFTHNRHPKDILRSLSHELVHHNQGCNGEYEDGLLDQVKPNYAQENPQLRRMESDAYLTGNLIFRDWEDWIKSDNDSKQLYESLCSTGKDERALLLELTSFAPRTDETASYVKDGLSYMDRFHDHPDMSPQGKSKFHFSLVQIFGDLLEDHDFSMISAEPAYAVDYENNGVQVTIFPFGTYGYESREAYQESDYDPEHKILVQIEFTDHDSMEQSVIHKKFDSFFDLHNAITKFLKSLQGDKNEKN